MPSILSRFRMRTLSQQSNTSAHSATLPVADPPQPAAILAFSPSRSEPMLVDRRIVEDLPALLGSLEATTAANPTAGALKPRTRKRSGLRSLGLGLKADPLPVQEPEAHEASEKENDELSAITPSGAGPSAWKGKQRASRIPSTGSPWSTFGRHRQRAARSPYGHGSSHPPSARSSRMASVDSAALHGSPVVGEEHTTSNLASSVSIDHTSNSRPTDSSRNLSVLSVLAGSLSNQSSRSHKSVAVTFGRQSPLLDDMLSAAVYAEVAYTSMPILPSTYSTESVTSRGNTFPRRHKRRKMRSRSGSQHRRMAQHHFLSPQTEPDISTSEVRAPNDGLHCRTETPGVPSEGVPIRAIPTGCLSPDGAGGRPPSDITAPHALHASSEVLSERPCSPPFIPPSLSLPSSSLPLDVETRGGAFPVNLSRSPPFSVALLGREESWMEETNSAASTPTRRPADLQDAPRRATSITSRTFTPSKSRSKRTSHLAERSLQRASSSSPQNGGAGPSSAAFPKISSPAPLTPQRIPRTPRTASEPLLRSVSEKSFIGPVTPTNNKGKRKAEDIDLTPPDQRTGQHTTFVIPTVNRRSPHASEVSKAPSSFRDKKRARISASAASPMTSPGHSRPASIQRQPTDSWPSRSGSMGLHRATSKTTSTRSARPESPSKGRRGSVSELSISLSALVTPHAPSMSIRSGGYYMRDPRATHVESTPWTLRRPSQDEIGSPSHAWMFFIGFVLFPLWWFASFWRIPQTRRVNDAEKSGAFELDDPQVEHDARSWRFRCRVMAVVSFLTYVPFIILVAIFVTRS